MFKKLKQIESVGAQKEFLCKLATANANSESKKILRALPLNPEPRTDQMVEVYAKLTSTEQTVVSK